MRNIMGHRGVQVGNLADKVRVQALDNPRPAPPPSRLDGMPAIEMIGGTRPLFITNDDWAEAALLKGRSPIDYNFGGSQGDIVGNNKGNVYEIYQEVPLRRHGLSVGIPTDEVLADFNQVRPTAGSPEVIWTDAAQGREDNRWKIDMLAQQMRAQNMAEAGIDPDSARGQAILSEYPKRWTSAPDIGGDASYPYRGNPEMDMLRPAPVAQFAPPSYDVTEQILAPGIIRNYSQTEQLEPNRYGVLVRSPSSVPNAFAQPVQPQGGFDLTTADPTITISGTWGPAENPTVNLPSTVYEDRGLSPYRLETGSRLPDNFLTEDEIGFNGFNDYGNTIGSFGNEASSAGYVDEVQRKYNSSGNAVLSKEGRAAERDRILAKADTLDNLQAQYGNRNDLFALMPRGTNYIEPNQSAYARVEDLQRAARQQNANYQNRLGNEAEGLGLSPEALQRELMLTDMAQRNPNLALLARAMADQPQSMATINSKSELQAMADSPMLAATDYDRQLINAYNRQEEMSRRAALGQFTLDDVQRQSMPLPDVQNVRVSNLDADGNFTQSVQPMDYRDVLAAVRANQQAGYGQLQQALPVQYDEGGDRFSVIQVGPTNIDSYIGNPDKPHKKYLADLGANVPFTQPNQFFSQPGPELSSRVFHGQQELPITLQVRPSRADDFVPEESIRVQPVYQYGREDMINTAGNRLRGEGYVPPGILTQAELEARVKGQSLYQPQPRRIDPPNQAVPYPVSWR